MTQDQLLLLLGLLLLAVAVFVAFRLLRSPKPEAPPAVERPAVPPVAAPVAPETGATAVEAADAPAAQPASAPSPYLPAPDGEADDLGRIKGIGPKLSARLKELGVFHYRQIAEWTPAQLAQVDSELGQFQGRPERDQWQSQARLLASGDVKAYERVHGKLGPDAPPGNPA
jgi:predicted flap endonuclease-1-like 5' DNA nuclease